MTAPHDKLAAAGIKPGDRVRVTFTGRVVSPRNGALDVIQDGEGSQEPIWFTRDDLSEEGFQIERIDPPLKVGDRVRFKRGYGDDRVSFELVAFREGQCVLWGPLESGMSSARGSDPVWLEIAP